jgi:hypothetical protein
VGHDPRAAWAERAEHVAGAGGRGPRAGHAAVAQHEVDVELAGGRVDPAPESAALRDQPLVRRLPAARAGDVVPLRVFYPRSFGQGLAVLDQLEEVLAGR